MVIYGHVQYAVPCDYTELGISRAMYDMCPYTDIFAEFMIEPYKTIPMKGLSYMALSFYMALYGAKIDVCTCHI